MSDAEIEVAAVLSRPSCPICGAKSGGRYQATPYWMCPVCDCWFQAPMPPKTYEAPHEKDAHGGSVGHLMSEQDKGVNRALAAALFRDWIKKSPAKTLDIGCVNVVRMATLHRTPLRLEAVR